MSLVSDPGARLVAPSDGRLRGDHLAATVTGVAWVDHVGFGASTRQAMRGQRLVVFGLQNAHVKQARDNNGKLIPPVTGTLIVDGQRSNLPADNYDDSTTPMYYLASVPVAARDVEVELAASGLAQTFSLTTGARTGVQPVVLYRDRVTWQPLDQVNGEKDLATPDPADGLPGATLPIRVRDVYLAWFGPDTPADLPAAPDRAWLVIDATSQDDSQITAPGPYLHYLSGLTADQVTLSLPGGQTITSQLLNPGTAEAGVGVFDGIYAFPVPADLTVATLTVAPGSLQVTKAFSGSAPVMVATHGQASFLVAFPAPYQPPPPVAPARADSSRTAVAPPSKTGSGSGGRNPAVPLAAAVVVLAGTVIVVARRRRAKPTDGPAVNQPTGVPPNLVPLGDEPSDQPEPTTGTPIPAAARTGPDLGTRPDQEPPAVARSASAPVPAATKPSPKWPPVLVPIPTGAPEPPSGVLYFAVLGPFRITGWPEDQPRSGSVIDLAAFLALHPDRAYTAEELRDPLSIGKPRALEADTIRTYAGTLRRALGAEYLPDAGRRGYALAKAVTDWQRFVEHTRPTGGREPAEEAQGLVAALGLVRGSPFSELPANGFGWVATELLVSQVEVAITDAAERLVELALAAGDWPLAAWAADRGLAVSPTAHQLNSSALTAAERSSRPDRLAQAWRDVTRRFIAAEEPVPGDLRQLHDQLRRGFTDATSELTDA